MYKLTQNFIKCSKYAYGARIYKDVLNNKYPNLRCLSTSYPLARSTIPEACPAHMSQKVEDDDWSSRCHVDKATWDSAKPFSKMPGLVKKIPIIGNTWQFLPGARYYGLTVYDFLNQFFRDFGQIGRMEGILGLEDRVFLASLDDVELVYKQEAMMPQRDILGSMTYFRANFRQDVFKDAKGLLTSNGEEWYTFRNKVNKIMMQPKVVKQYIKPVNTIALEFVDKIKRIRKPDGTVGDIIMNEFNKWALESIACLALDQRLGCLEDNLPPDSLTQRMVHNAEKIFEIGQLLDFKPNLWRYISTRNYRKGMKLYDEQITMAQTQITNAMEKIKQKKQSSQLNAGEEEKEKSVLEKLWDIDPKVATVMVSDMLLAGIDTTSTALINVFYYLSSHPDKQQRLRDEIKSILPDKTSLMTSEDLSNMPYLKACIKEAARLYPVTPGTMRNLSKDTVLSGYQVPKGTKILLTHMNLSIQEDQFPKPLEFIPERWLRENSESEISYKKAHPFATMHFGFGARSCIGRRFADLEMEVAIINFIRNFKMEWQGDAPLKVTTSINYLKGPWGFIFNDIK